MAEYKMPKKETLGEKVVDEKLGEKVINEKVDSPISEEERKRAAAKEERPEYPGVPKAVDESYDKVVAAMAGRLESDIPLNDEYWTIKNEEAIKWNLARDLAEKALIYDIPPQEQVDPANRSRALEESSTTSLMERQEESSHLESVERQSLRK